MSAGAEFWVIRELLENLKLSHVELRVILYLAKWSRNDTYRVWHSEETIAKRIGCGRASVSRAVHKFAKMNLLHIKRTKREGTEREYNIYHLHVPYKYRQSGYKALNSAPDDEDFDSSGELNSDLHAERVAVQFEEQEQWYADMNAKLSRLE